jgi:serine/threonine protein kinase
VTTWSHAPGEVIAGKYRVIGTLGQGGMGSVYEAVNDAVGRRVAIKLLNANLAEHPEYGKRFEMEARAAGLIDHPGIVDVLDYGRPEEGAPYIVMEHLQGATVRTLQKALGAFTAEQACAVVVPVLEALAKAHDAGVVHRDLKPANIFVVVRPHRGVKILDFGISKFSGVGAGMTHTGTTLGTPAFMAPELLKDGRAAGPATDLYAVGAVLYALVTGHPPYDADSEFALVAQILTTQHQPALEARPDLPPDFAALIDALLHKAVEKRPGSAAAVKAQLVAMCASDEKGLYAMAEQLTPDLAPIPAAQPSAPPRRAGSGSSRALATPLASGSESPTVTDRGTPGPPPFVPLPMPAPPLSRRQKRLRLAVALSALLLVSGGGTFAALTLTKQTPEDLQEQMRTEALRAGARQTQNNQQPEGAAKYEDFVGLLDQARALNKSGQAEQAVKLLDEALAKATQSGDPRAEGWSMRNRGNLAEDLGKCAESAGFLLRALKLFERIGDQRGVGMLANDLGMLGMKCAEIDRIPWFKLAVKARWQIRDLEGVRRSANNLGVSYLSAGDFENAQQAYNEALIAASELNDSGGIMKVRSNLAYVGILQAAGSSLSPDPKKLQLDPASPRYKKAKSNLDQSLAAALDAGFTLKEVCNPWDRYREICETLSAKEPPP